jgi:decaprenylphospho-beta-D-ribofuranose 2-oxidase
MTGSGHATLPAERLEGFSSWGENLRVMSYVYRPSVADAIPAVFETAREQGVSVGLRGAGCSYGDASLNRERITLDLTRMNRILGWNPETGVLRAEPGVTIRQVWEHAIGDGWWPAVVPGTMFPTVAGVAAMNIHGKNHVHVGPIGEHIREFDLLLPGGETRRCSPRENAELFHAAIGGFGMLGVMTSVTLQLRRVHSGRLRVTPNSAANWNEMFAAFRERTADADYIVGWIDCFAHGADAGRGLIHTANYLAPGEDPEPARTLQVRYQELGDTVLGFLPKSTLYRFLGPVFRPKGMRRANAAQYLLGARKSGTPHLETHAAFAFMLDYVPNWKRAYGPGGLLQYQTFLPDATAEAVFRSQLERCRRAGLVPLLGVFKVHRADKFLMSYAVDGWSLALDFARTTENQAALVSLFAEMDREVVAAGGRFYFAKDSLLQPERLGTFFAEPRVQRFLELKREIDPENLLQTDLYRRIFGAAAGIAAAS